MIKNVFFDVDDTVISYQESFPGVIKEMFGKYGYSYDINEVKRAYTEQSTALWDAVERGEISGTELRNRRWPQIMRALNLPEGEEMELENVFRTALSHNYPLEKGALELFKYLKEKGYKVVIASNACQWQQEIRIEKSGLGQYTYGVYCSNEIGFEKPHKEFFDAVLKMSDSKPEETLMVGDSITADVGGAKNAGLKACWYNPNGNEDTVGADYVIGSLTDLMKIL